MAKKLPFSPLVRPMMKCRRRAVKQNFTQVYPGQTTAAFPGYLNSYEIPTLFQGFPQGADPGAAPCRFILVPRWQIAKKM